MKEIRSLFYLSLCLLSLLSINISCMSAGKSVKDCQISDERSKKPGWVNKNPEISCCYTGVGTAPYNDAKTAKRNALSDLTENIKITVTSKFESKIISDNKNNKTKNYSKHLEKTIFTRSDIELSDIKIEDRWLDAETCELSILVKAKRSLIDNLIKLSKAQQLSNSAKNIKTKQSPLRRINNIDEAIAIIKTVDFKMLPIHYGGKASFLEKYNTIKKDLVVQFASSKIAYLVFTDENIKEEIRKTIADKFLKNDSKNSIYLKSKGCNSKETCLTQARENRSEKLVLISVNTIVSNGSMGLWKAELNLSISAYDVETGRKEVDTFSYTGKKFYFEEDGVQWIDIVENIWEKNEFQVNLGCLKKL